MKELKAIAKIFALTGCHAARTSVNINLKFPTFAFAKHIAYSLLVVTISVCMLPDAESTGFSSPSGIGTTIYEAQLDGARFVAKHDSGHFAYWQNSHVRLKNAPAGLSISGGEQSRRNGFDCRSSDEPDCIELNLSWAGDVSSDTTVTVQVIGEMVTPRSCTDCWRDLASFTIKPTTKELRVGTPTNSSTVTEVVGTSKFTVRLGQVPAGSVTVNVASSDTSEGTVSPSTLTFTTMNYNVEQTVTVTGADDNVADGSQSWNVVLEPSSNGDSGYNDLSEVNVAMTTIDDDPNFSSNSPSMAEVDSSSVSSSFMASLSSVSLVTRRMGNETPSFSIDSPSVMEGDSGSANLTFTVSLSSASTSQLTVDYTDAGTGTATSGTDYTAVTGSTLMFAAGDTSKTITVSVTGDTTYEGNETVVIALSNASAGARIATATGTGTITDNETPSFSIDSPSVTEGNSGSVSLIFTVTLSVVSTSQLTVDYTDAGTGTATSGTDYTAVTGSTLTFAAGDTSKTITVLVTGDTDAETNETVVIVLSNASAGASIATATGTGTIVDNETPSFSIADTSVTEGDSGSANLTFTVTLSSAGTSQLTVNYADAGTGTATSGTDYTAVTAGMLTFPIGTTTQTITVLVTGDTMNEPDETVVIALSNASTGANIARANGTGTITNDDPGLSIADAMTVTEGASPAANLVFTVTLLPAATAQVTVDFAVTTTPGVGKATSSDYTINTSSPLTFAIGDTSKDITVSVTDDSDFEGPETMEITLSNASAGVSIVRAKATGMINDDDGGTQSIGSPVVEATDEEDMAVLDELDTEIVAKVAREITTGALTAVSSRIAVTVGGSAVVEPPASGIAGGNLLSILERAVLHSERERSLPRSELSMDGARFVYSPSVIGLGASSQSDTSGKGLSSTPTVWGSLDYRNLSGSGIDALKWDGDLTTFNIGTDMKSDCGVLVGLAVGFSKGSFSYRDSTGGSEGTVKMRMNTLNPYVGWTVSELASLWAIVGYGKGKINYNDDGIGAASSKMSLTSAALGGRYRLFTADSLAGGNLLQVELKGEIWGLRGKVKGDARRPVGPKSRAHGVRVAVERHRRGVLESGALLTLTGEAGLRWDGGDGDAGAGFEIGGSADSSNSATGMRMIAKARALVDHESGRKDWNASLTAGWMQDRREPGLSYRASLSHGQAESEVDSLWDRSAASRASEVKQLVTRMETEIGYRLYGTSGMHTPYVGFGVEDGGTRDYRIGIRYAGESAVSSGLEFKRYEASGKSPDHRVMLTGQMNW